VNRTATPEGGKFKKIEYRWRSKGVRNSVEEGEEHILSYREIL